VLTAVRGLVHRGAANAIIALVALVAIAGAAAGPIYDDSARTTMLRDTVAAAPVTARGVESDAFGSLNTVLPELRNTLGPALDQETGSPGRTDRLFTAPVEALETELTAPRLHGGVGLVWHSGACVDVQILAGRCPTKPDQVIVSRSFVTATHVARGEVIAAPAFRTDLRVVGVYAPPNPEATPWFGRGELYFPQEELCGASPGSCSQSLSTVDVAFTPRATFRHFTGQGEAVLDRLVATDRLQPGDVAALQRVGDTLPYEFQAINVQTSISQTMATVHQSWSSLATSILVVTGELLLLVWMLLYVVVTDAVEVRGPELALARLRGAGRLRTLRFALAEPTTIVVIAVPLGVLLGWLAAHLLATAQLAPGPSTGLPARAWLLALVAAAGALVAVVAAARSVLSRSVVEQWRRTTRQAVRRTWVLDAVAVTAAAAGLVQLVTGGTIGSGHRSPLALLAPGLLGLAVAILGSRVLPLLARAAFARTSRRGGVGNFLAVRHIGRRTAGARTTVILATAAALATFAVATWSIAHTNRMHAAELTVGAGTVFTVNPLDGTAVDTLIRRADPAGTNATVVAQVNDGGPVTVAIQPSRFAAVADWSAAGVSEPAQRLAPLAPTTLPPIQLTGQRVRVHLHAGQVHPHGASLLLDVLTRDATVEEVALGPLTPGAAVRSGRLDGCPCRLVDAEVTSHAASFGGAPVEGSLTLGDLETRTGSHWAPVTQGGRSPAWTSPDRGRVTPAGEGGVSWLFAAPQGVAAILAVDDHPVPLPVIPSAGVAVEQLQHGIAGLDGRSLPVDVRPSLETVPGASEPAVLVDLDFAELQALDDTSAATLEVWVRHDPGPIAAALHRAGIPIIATASTSALAQQYARQGPGLASVVFVADAAVAAILAALAAIFGLAVAAGRRRYEYAALLTSGVPRRQLLRALAIEQLAVVGFGVIVGVATGAVATALVARDVPEFIVRPPAIALHYSPSYPLLLAVLGGGALVVLTLATVAAWGLLRSIGAGRLRAGPA
jgi:hypothetical protein